MIITFSCGGALSLGAKGVVDTVPKVEIISHGQQLVPPVQLSLFQDPSLLLSAKPSRERERERERKKTATSTSSLILD